MMQKKTFQIILDELRKCLPMSWDKLVVYLEYGEGSYSFAFYVNVNGKYINGFNLPDASEKKIADSFKKIDKAILKERKASKEEPWTNMTMTVDAKGKMHTDFDYTDLTEGAYKYKKQWKANYLH